jgi:two-component sensor histidine kinase
MVASSAVPHQWTSREIGLMEETAERTWAAIERARAEAGLREREAELQVLVGELQHRTRNLIGVVRALSDRTAKGSTDLAIYAVRFKARLAALGRAQALLSGLKTHNRVTFDQLLRTELDAIGEDGRIRTSGPTGIRLRTITVQMLALAIHELVTNAVKYGALSQPEGRLNIGWSEADEQSRLKITWSETGISLPPDDGTGRHGGGRELIERALPCQLQAKTTFELTPTGLICTLDLPVSQHEEPANE